MRSDILAIGFALCFVSNQANSPFFSGTDVSNEFRDVLWNGHMFFCSYAPSTDVIADLGYIRTSRAGRLIKSREKNSLIAMLLY